VMLIWKVHVVNEVYLAFALVSQAESPPTT